MLGTGVRQLRFAWSMLSGRPLPEAAMTALVDDLRATLAAFGSPGDGANDLLSIPDPELQEDLARRRLRRTIQQAAEHTPYYRTWFAANGVDPGSITPATASLVAPTTKAALRSTPGMFVSNRANPALAATTSGTTGIPTVVWFSRRELDVAAALTALGLMLAGQLRPEHVWVNCISSRSLAVAILDRAIPMVGATFMHVGLVRPEITLDRLATPLHLPGKAAQPTHCNVTASYLAALVDEAERGGWQRRDFGLREIHAGGEVVTDALRLRAAEVFGAQVVDGYSMTEILPVAGQACGAGHLHIPIDQGLVEVLDPQDHTPALPGAVGVLTITPYAMYRETTTLLRYLTGDLVRVLPEGEPLRCEMAGVPATSRILGRLLTDPARFTAPVLTTRDLLEVLQSEHELPLPTRFAVSDTTSGPVLHVLARRRSRSLLARIEDRVAAAALPLHGVELVDDPAALPMPCHVRADLREHTFAPPLGPAATAAVSSSAATQSVGPFDRRHAGAIR